MQLNVHFFLYNFTTQLTIRQRFIIKKNHKKIDEGFVQRVSSNASLIHFDYLLSGLIFLQQSERLRITVITDSFQHLLIKSIDRRING